MMNPMGEKKVIPASREEKSKIKKKKHTFLSFLFCLARAFGVKLVGRQ